MDYELKNTITFSLRKGLDTYNDRNHEVCEYVTLILEKKYPGCWIVVAGKMLTANITH